MESRCRVERKDAWRDSQIRLPFFCDCHPEQREGPWCLLAAAVGMAQARTEIPRYARDDNGGDGRNGNGGNGEMTMKGYGWQWRG
jgi:hypothetical protein